MERERERERGRDEWMEEGREGEEGMDGWTDRWRGGRERDRGMKGGTGGGRLRLRLRVKFVSLGFIPAVFVPFSIFPRQIAHSINAVNSRLVRKYWRQARKSMLSKTLVRE